MSEPPLELPFEAHLLIPFIVACRDSPDASDDKVRLAYIVAAMKRYDSTFDESKAKGALEALEMRTGAIKSEYGKSPLHLCPKDATCVCCGSGSHFTSDTRTLKMHTIGSVENVDITTTTCSACGCSMRYSTCSADVASIALFHKQPKIVTPLKARLELALGISVRVVKLDATSASSPSLMLVRGFDSVPIAMPLTQVLLDCREAPLPTAPDAPPPPSVPPSEAPKASRMASRAAEGRPRVGHRRVGLYSMAV